MDAMMKCLEHGHKVDLMLDQMGTMHESVNTIAAYVPKIEVALERLANVQDILHGYADIHKELFRLQRSTTETLNVLAVKVSTNEGRLSILEESRKGVLSIVSPVATWAIVALLGALALLSVTHGIGMGK